MHRPSGTPCASPNPNQAIGSDMPMGLGPSAGATACITGSSTGVSAITPRAAWCERLGGRVVGVGQDHRAAPSRRAHAGPS